jgi:hypothetical protein
MPPPTGITLPGRTCSALLFSDFAKNKNKKEMTFFLV